MPKPTIQNFENSTDQEEDTNNDKDIQLRKKVFMDKGDPIPMFLHPNLGRGGIRAMTKKIKAAGGNPSVDEDNAEVIICREDHPVFDKLEFKYSHHLYVWVEPPTWVDDCILRGQYEHTPLIAQKNKHYIRTEFTVEDDRHLANFLAHRIPFKDMRGRTGNKVYQELCDPQWGDTYPWAHRHTWHSWRERYKKNREAFDRAIERAVEKDPPEPGGKGQYVIARTSKRATLRYAVDYDETDEGEEDDAEDEADSDEVAAQLEKISHNKRPRTEEDLRRRRRTGGAIQQRAASPPRKKRRNRIVYSYSEDELIDSGKRDKGKGREWEGGRERNTRANTEPEDEAPAPPEDDPMLDFNPQPGASQFDDPFSSGPSPPPTAVKPTQRAAVSHSKAITVQAVAGPSNQMLPPPRKSVTSKVPPSIAPPDTQATLVAPPQPRAAAPPDTQATLVPSSQPQPQLQPQRRHEPLFSARRARQELPQQQKHVYRMTRSGSQSVSAELNHIVLPLGTSTNRGGRKKVEQPKPQSPMQPIREESQQAGVLQPSVGASLRDEERVEELLQPADDHDSGDGSSDDESSSSSDDQATQTLQNRHKSMIEAATASGPAIPNNVRPVAPKTPTKIRNIDLSRVGPNSLSRKAKGPPSALLNIQGQLLDTDADATPKPRIKAAKKIASRDPGPMSDESDSDAQSETRTETTSDSFPPEATTARQYKAAQSPFTPAPGTRAEARVLRERKGKGKAL